jgi:hypothetical protein
MNGERIGKTPDDFPIMAYPGPDASGILSIAGQTLQWDVSFEKRAWVPQERLRDGFRPEIHTERK